MDQVSDLRNQVWAPELNTRIGEYQTLAKAFFEDLKSEGIITLDNVFDELIDDKKINRLFGINLDIMVKLNKSSEFTGDEQFHILCLIYLSCVEQIRSIILPYAESIFKKNPKTQRKKKMYQTLGSVMSVLKNYKKSKFLDLFSDINIDLRNAIGHSNIDYGETEISYNDKIISGLDLMKLAKKMVVLFPIIYNSPMQVFKNEIVQQLQKYRS